jgi:acetyl-CoA carboxylase biotin carboxyl carrier protein
MSDNTASAKANQSKSDEPKDPSFNMDELRELAELVNEHGFTDFEFENENIRVRLSKTAPAAAVQTVPVVAPTVQTAAPVVEAETPIADSDAGLFKITSPIVGTFYGAPGPDKEPYVREGSKVTPESVVCIVEAMKLMNEIQAETSGEVVKIYVENGQPVEYGQPLFGIKQ